jgi:hypothetical protein
MIGILECFFPLSVGAMVNEFHSTNLVFFSQQSITQLRERVTGFTHLVMSVGGLKEEMILYR